MINYDDTCETAMEKTLQKYVQQLEEANTELEQFVYIASHDLREPLIGVAGYASLLKRRHGDNLDETGTRWLDQIIEGTKSMEKKLDDLLTLSRAGRNITRGTFPLGSAVDEARRNLAGPLSNSQATVVVAGLLPEVRGDRSMIAQVFQNLFSNSIKYAGDKPAYIEVSATSEDQWCTVTVQDNGIGFDPRHAERIFGVFQRLYTIEEYPGTGVGLAIVKKVVERHGGQVWAKSEPDKGSIFCFNLPLA